LISLPFIVQILKADEGAIEVLWKQRCSSSAYFTAAGLVLVQTYEWLGNLAGCGEQVISSAC
jgi:hypothetical protein